GGATFVRWGRTICSENETELVYHGIVAGPKYSDKGGGSEYICLAMPVGPYAYDDAINEWSSSLSGTEDPERITGEGANEDGSLLYPVEVSCGFLPCPPFVDGREVGCAVCTK
ncbi:hypothetical protein ScPMuIL_013496, partial [Solemya velum]